MRESISLFACRFVLVFVSVCWLLIFAGLLTSDVIIEKNIIWCYSNMRLIGESDSRLRAKEINRNTNLKGEIR